MPRIRTIKPEFATDEKLASVSRDARLTFVLLVTQVDDDGLVNGRWRQLLGVLYPHDEDVGVTELQAWITQLERIGAVRWRSTFGGAPVLELVNWSKHQKIDHKGRSLLLKELVPLDEPSRVPREALASESRDPRPRTLDLGPSTVDPVPAAASRGRAKTQLAKAANDALDAAFGTTDHRPAILPSTGAALLEMLDAEQIPVEFAITAIQGAVPELKAPPRSMAYFVPIVRERWEQRLVARPTGLPAIGPRPGSKQARNMAALAEGLRIVQAQEALKAAANG